MRLSMETASPLHPPPHASAPTSPARWIAPRRRALWPASASQERFGAPAHWGPYGIPLNQAPALPEAGGPAKSAAGRVPLDDIAAFALPGDEPFNPDAVFADYNSLLDEFGRL